MFCCILKSNFGIRNLFFYPFSVKIMLKTHQKTVWRPGSTRTRLGSLSAPPDPIAAIWDLLLRGGEGKGRKGKGGGEGRVPNYTFWLRQRREGLKDRDGRGKKGEGREGGN